MNTTRFIRRFAAVTALLVGGALHAQDFPSQPIKLLIPYPPGGSADMLARPLTAQLQKELGQPVVLEYKAGAGGTIATSQLARSKPDGHTILMVLAAHAINPNLYPDLPYDTRKDFAPVSLVATLPLLVAAPFATPANTIQELVAYAKKNPDKLTFASAGNGNTSHLAAEMFKATAGIKMLHIPYKGSGPAVVALLAGDVSLMFDSISTSLPQVKANKLKPLAVTGANRSPLLPDVPTVKESGFPDFVVNGWYGILAPAGTPRPVIDKLNKAFANAARVPATTQQLNGFGYDVVASTPEEFGQHMEKELGLWEKTIKDAGVKM
ncbi:tripartite tricarboxylate transporter substrate binding protein [Candidimonas sp. SYP-B2681]|uniref:Bug family tripartite tricarboxylate transporter substrate binding protein n=1 Tax=Candidimonas sp. SYP-B2681 TaxID=2497686 RepID=UPI000F87E7B6|nr:tripartite tricarboxylate transporter substrate binding protein [Candidimonas sp. SYP-B2681]RTZ41678.1 tripartite tricarboxylate transporter substrate binding protein [Candidimonas sp. SYP-B2681]